MDDNRSASSTIPPQTLDSLPSEILQQIFRFTTSTTFFQLIQVNRKFFSIASQSRELILHHLRHVPGIKLGLGDRSTSTNDLFLLFRQRAASHLYGVNFTADCRNLAPSLKSGGILDPRASCLTRESDGLGSNTCLVFKNSLQIRMNCHNNGIYGETIGTPYADGRAKIIQVVQKSYYISVLYAWTPPEKDLTEDTSHPEPTIPWSKKQTEAHTTRYDTRDGHRYSSRRGQPKPSSSSSPRVRYHLLHYDLFRSDRPVFFHIPTHKSLRNKSLTPIHMAVHNRLQCAILWDVSDTLHPTPHATVCLYTAEHLPRYEQGIHDVWVIYPFDHPALYHRPGTLVGERELVLPDFDCDDDMSGSSGRIIYTYTKDHQPSSNGGRDRDSESDLRLLHFPLKPRSLSFFKEGRRLSLFAPGSSTPFTTLLANEAIRSRLHPSTAPPFYPGSAGNNWPRSLCRRVRRTNHTSILGHHFTLSLPFYSKHETISRPLPENPDPDADDPIPEIECVTNLLALGTARIPSFTIPAAGGDITGSGPEVLMIVQIRKRVPFDLCLHSESMDELPTLPRPPREPRRRRTHTNPNAGQDLDFNIPAVPDIPAEDENEDNDDENSVPDVEILSDTEMDDTDLGALDGTDLRVVARLWGWNAQSTTLTGSESVSVSPRGERIAVSQWNKVLIYALNPGALCEELWDGGNDSDNDDNNNNEGGSNSDNDSESGNETGNEDEDASAVSVAEAVNEEADGDHETSDENNNHDDTTQQPTPPSEPFLSLSTDIPDPSTLATPKAPSSVSSSPSTSFSHLWNYYPHVLDKHLGGSLVQLHPIVLKMDGGAVVRKMSWGLGRSVRVREDESGSSDEDEEIHREEQGEEVVVDKTGDEKEKGREEEGIEIDDGSDGPKQPTTQGGDVESGQDNNIRIPTDVEISNSQLRPQTSKPSISDLASDIPAKNTHAKPLEQTPSITPDEIPPAPFSDMKLTGQIKHIGRPPEYYSFPNKIVLDPPLEMRPPSPAESELGKGKQKDETQTTTAGEEGQVESKGVTMPDQDQDQDQDQSLPLEKSVSEVASSPTRSESEFVQPQSKTQRKRKRKPRKRVAENELIVMTDRGLQVWDLSVWGTGKRVRSELDCNDVLH